jgi:hypothetical protein
MLPRPEIPLTPLRHLCGLYCLLGLKYFIRSYSTYIEQEDENDLSFTYKLSIWCMLSGYEIETDKDTSN